MTIPSAVPRKRQNASANAPTNTASMVTTAQDEPLETGTPISQLRDILKRSPTNFDALCALGHAHQAAGDHSGAETAFRSASTVRPMDATPFGSLADLYLTQGRLAEALDHCKTAVALSRAAPQASHYVTGGRILCELGQLDEAMNALTSAASLEPDNPEVHVAFGLLFDNLDRPIDAFTAYQHVLRLRPRDVLAYNNLAGVLIRLKQFDLAVSTARAVVSLAPDHSDVYLNLATALRLSGDHAEALATYKTIVALKPDHGEALVELSHRLRHICDWDGLKATHEASLVHSYRKGCLVSPFAIMTSTDSPAEQLACARVWGKRLSHAAPGPLALYEPRPEAARGQRIRLGYLSADFHDHATAMLIVDMLETQDRSRFELFAYSLGPDDGSQLRHRIVKAFDKFVDLRPLSDADAARSIHGDRMDILLDLKGYTQNARVRILAFRPAPIQVNYLSFPGTMGAPFFDYVIGDAHVTPMEDQAFFDEKIVHLPHSYQPNDRYRRPAPNPGTRAHHGLPDQGFVFCCFNSAYKITPDVFDIWMRLLAATPGSVLWLLVSNPTAAENLREEARRRGVDSSRLVLAPFVTPENHLARLSLADLFLDTLPVNAHTTGSEALWAGLPVLTCVGKTFAGRVAASLLHAVDLSDLVTHSLLDYEATALRLAQEPNLLASFRDRLQRQRSIAPLFDTPRYTRAFERALLRMVALRDAGIPPTPFAVADDER